MVRSVATLARDQGCDVVIKSERLQTLTVLTRAAQRAAGHSSARTARRAVQSFVTVGREVVEPQELSRRQEPMKVLSSHAIIWIYPATDFDPTYLAELPVLERPRKARSAMRTDLECHR